MIGCSVPPNHGVRGTASKVPYLPQGGGSSRTADTLGFSHPKLQSDADRGPRGDGPVAAGTQSRRRGKEGAAARPDCGQRSGRRGTDKEGLGTTERTLTGTPECTEADGRTDGRTDEAACLRRRPRDTHQTREGGEMEARGRRRRLRRRRRRDVRAARERPSRAGRLRGSAAAEPRRERTTGRTPTAGKDGSAEGPRLPGTPSDCREGPPRPRLRMRHPPAALARRRDCACAAAPRPHLHPSPGCA